VRLSALLKDECHRHSHSLDANICEQHASAILCENAHSLKIFVDNEKANRYHVNALRSNRNKGKYSGKEILKGGCSIMGEENLNG